MTSRVSTLSHADLLTALLNKKDTTTLMDNYENIHNILSAPIEEIQTLLHLSDIKKDKLEITLELIRRGSDRGNHYESCINARVNALAIKYQYETREHIICLFIGYDGNITAERILSYGGPAGAFIDMPYMYRLAIRLEAAELVFIHNHPDGSEGPSKEDIAIAEKIGKALELLNIRLRANYILAAGNYTQY